MDSIEFYKYHELQFEKADECHGKTEQIFGQKRRSKGAENAEV